MRVAVLRVGSDVVMSVAPDYEGPPSEVALVVPVPTTLRRQDVRVVPRSVFDRLDRITAPRLTESWELDPCDPLATGSREADLHWSGRSPGHVRPERGGPPIVDEDVFHAGEYEVTILGARASSSLARWLADHDYDLADGAADRLRPYVSRGMRFLVARVPADRITFEDGRAALAGLRIHYRDESLSLPVGLAALGSAIPRDLLVYVLSPGQRFEAASHPAVTLPTNLRLRPSSDAPLAGVYASVFDAALTRHPGAVVTEYVRRLRECVGCGPARGLTPDELLVLGEDVAPRPRPDPVVQTWQDITSQIRMPPPTVTGALSVDAARRVSRRRVPALRACYDAALRDQPQLSGSATLDIEVAPEGTVPRASVRGELVEASGSLRRCLEEELRSWRYEPAPAASRVTAPITLTATGSGDVHHRTLQSDPEPFVLTRMRLRRHRDAEPGDLSLRAAPPIAGGRTSDRLGEFEGRAMPAEVNEFQTRFVVEHSWEGPIPCEHPERGRYGPRPEGDASDRADDEIASIGGSPVELARVLERPVPSLGVDVVEPVLETPPPSPPVTDTDPSELPAGSSPPPETGCACRAVGGPSGGPPTAPLWMLASLALAWVSRRIRRSSLFIRGSTRRRPASA